MVIIRSCMGVTIRNVNTILPTPNTFMIRAADFEGIFLEKLTKKNPKQMERHTIPKSAHNLPGLSAPLTALESKRLLIKFFVQSNPTEFLSKFDPPGYTEAAMYSNIVEANALIKTRCFRIIYFGWFQLVSFQFS
jgi:hypothetical protein